MVAFLERIRVWEPDPGPVFVMVGRDRPSRLRILRLSGSLGILHHGLHWHGSLAAAGVHEEVLEEDLGSAGVHGTVLGLGGLDDEVNAAVVSQCLVQLEGERGIGTHDGGGGRGLHSGEGGRGGHDGATELHHIRNNCHGRVVRYFLLRIQIILIFEKQSVTPRLQGSRTPFLDRNRPVIGGVIPA